MLTFRDTALPLAGTEGVLMYARLVSFATRSGKESVATELAGNTVGATELHLYPVIESA